MHTDYNSHFKAQKKSKTDFLLLEKLHRSIVNALLVVDITGSLSDGLNPDLQGVGELGQVLGVPLQPRLMFLASSFRFEEALDCLCLMTDD